MKQMWTKMTAFAIALTLVTPAALLAQKEEKTDKGDKEKKEVQQVIITRKGDKAEKIVVEINGDKVTVNGKPLEEYKNKNGDINVRLNNLKDIESLTFSRSGKGGDWNYNMNDNFKMFSEDANRAMLGVTTEKTDEGALIQDITNESAAEKIGLKEDDIITKIDDKKIEGPEDLTAAIKAHKPGDKVTVTYLRDKKEQKATAELTKWKGMNLFTTGEPFGNYKMDLGDMHLDKVAPNLNGLRGLAPYGGQNWSWSGGSPKLGLSVQDTDDGKGVKVVEVDDESNAAKAGIKEEDIITQLDDKQVNSVDEISKLLREKKDNPTVRFQLTRNGKSQTIEVKMPKKIKTADL